MRRFLQMKRKLAIGLALLLTMICGVALADETASEDDGLFAVKNFGASVTLTTDYVFRGVSQTDENPAIQGSFDYKHPVSAYLGVWASNVDESISKGNIEIDYYAGFTRELFKGFSFDVSARNLR
jgi:uncharacterized protein (TIGR02001 family)